MSLMTFEDVRPWARMIKQRTGRREMPPWFIDKTLGIQRFKDDPSLSDEEIAMVAKWADSGAPAGNPADMPPLRKFPDGTTWTIGTPDLIISSPLATIKAMAPDRYFSLGSTPMGLTEDRLIKAVEIKEVRLTMDSTPLKGALNLFSVHHSGVRTVLPGEYTPGAIRAEGGFHIVYELGQNALIYPDDVAARIRAGSELMFDNNHMHSIGTDIQVRLDVGFKFYPKGYTPKYILDDRTIIASTQDLDIPAGQSNIMKDAFYIMPQPGKLLSFEPHLHSSGKRMCVEVMYPDRTREVLNCANYNHNWVKNYIYEDDAQPLLPKGTLLHVIGYYDNSPSNPQVVDPRNWKGWGQRSIDDMFIFSPRMLYLTEEQFAEEVAAREAKERAAHEARRLSASSRTKSQ